MMRFQMCSAALLLAGAFLHAQDIPAGWKAVKNKPGNCQLATPSDWTRDTFSAAFQMSPDKKSTAVVSVLRSGQSFADGMVLAKQVMTPTKVIEDSPKRLWFEYENPGPKVGTNWYVAVSTSPVCTAQVTFKDPAFEATAKKIALSLSQAK